ncbi:cytochrome C biogenesis protein [Alteromonas stellipolaris]|uniref:cytochrome c biogenesis heme-transporting ATPase CcmA n=1 Tax=Alteromonas TaxID=226 RepID=UPI0007706A06|nr:MULTISPECIES: cytochrome c biogenesis heme-transporting ATPase CcmA [Alteromonas]AMJ89817.1 cytochrome C biogenesis protein [Alteromonas sp. Mac2]AMJ85962.1 cytochrome C biogenesis protein [Alteromonas sp. Mac1]AMJ93654.1 cytochrome C biogenesis protein [Alteromonas stellipolaris]ANB26282.1 heme ABC exporter ATP-binding protein CcmA [Alteromonas stellipolaris]MDO6534212.1 cytochrome c biogenesis heme-transporting ATPase CcmA [Alteromonas stellipolaris]
MSGLCASGLTCIKRDRVLFDDFSLNLNAGELVYLRGPNGAGKTSLLRILTGLSSPEHGDVTFDGVNINSNPSLYYQNLIYLGHKSALNGALSAVDNLRFWLAQHGIQNKDLTQASNIDNTIYRVLENLGLVGLEDVPVRFLSAGQQRRVALSRLWLKPAVVWVLDEPFTALDTAGVVLLERKMKQHVADGGMIITTSHQALSSEAGTHRCVDLEYRF